MLKNNFYEQLHAALKRLRKFASPASSILRSFPAFYFAIFLMAGYALWEARTPVTTIAPFQVPKADLPFNGGIVADALQDALKSIRNEIEEETHGSSLRSSETGLPDLRNMLIPKFPIQDPPRFSVEVKGVSYERILSIARAIRRTETTISGDVVLKGNQFILTARTADGPWESISSPISADGLKEAVKDLANKILMTQDPTLEGVALLIEGQGEQALTALDRARSLSPTDARLKFNFCMGFAANRRYEEAIECYKNLLTTDSKSSKDVWEQLAQAYYLQGRRKEAMNLYRQLAYKQDYREALLGLGEALDDDKESQAALNVYDDFLATERQDRNLAIAHVIRI